MRRGLPGRKGTRASPTRLHGTLTSKAGGGDARAARQSAQSREHDGGRKGKGLPAGMTKRIHCISDTPQPGGRPARSQHHTAPSQPHDARWPGRNNLKSTPVTNSVWCFPHWIRLSSRERSHTHTHISLRGGMGKVESGSGEEKGSIVRTTSRTRGYAPSVASTSTAVCPAYDQPTTRHDIADAGGPEGVHTGGDTRQAPAAGGAYPQFNHAVQTRGGNHV